LHDKPTGVRTMGLVGLASAMIVAVSDARGGLGDATRAVQGIMTGIGFLGAGVIVKEAVGDRIHGLTTAATIWLVSALGVACGLGEWQVALIATGLALLVLVLGGSVEKWLHQRWRSPGAHSPSRIVEGEPPP
jgi:putative Mg2+ transporter-C (MgtC) family protein